MAAVPPELPPAAPSLHLLQSHSPTARFHSFHLPRSDYDNYIDIIIDASSKHAARALLALRAYYTKEGYSSVYNPGGEGTFRFRV